MRRSKTASEWEKKCDHKAHKGHKVKRFGCGEFNGKVRKGLRLIFNLAPFACCARVILKLTGARSAPCENLRALRGETNLRLRLELARLEISDERGENRVQRVVPTLD